MGKKFMLRIHVSSAWPIWVFFIAIVNHLERKGVNGSIHNVDVMLLLHLSESDETQQLKSDNK